MRRNDPRLVESPLAIDSIRRRSRSVDAAAAAKSGADALLDLAGGIGEISDPALLAGAGREPRGMARCSGGCATDVLVCGGASVRGPSPSRGAKRRASRHEHRHKVAFHRLVLWVLDRTLQLVASVAAGPHDGAGGDAPSSGVAHQGGVLP